MATAALLAVLATSSLSGCVSKGARESPPRWRVLCLVSQSHLVALAIFILVVAVTRYVSLGSILGAIAFPVAAYFMQNADWLSLLLASAYL